MLTARTLCLVFALSTLLCARPALACKCAPPPSPAQALAQADAVFEGRVTAIEDVPAAGKSQDAEKRVTFSIVRVWKNLENVETLTLTTSASSAACGFPFEPSTSYLVYASRAAVNGSTREPAETGLSAHACSRTRPMADASEDLAALGGGVTPVKITPAPVPKADAATEPSSAEKQAGGCSKEPQGKRQAGPGALALPVLGSWLWISRRKTKAKALRRS